jgi:hypothetical protein
MSANDPGLLVRCASSMVAMGGVDEIATWAGRAEDLAGPDFAFKDDLLWVKGCVHWARDEPEAAEPLLRAAFYGGSVGMNGVPLADTYIALDRHDRALAVVEESLRRGDRHPALRDMRAWLLETQEQQGGAE